MSAYSLGGHDTPKSSTDPQDGLAGRLRFTATSGPRNRFGRIFIDYLRNARGATTAAEFSLRARPGMGVSMPVRWDELPTLRGADEWDMRSAVARQRRFGMDAWHDYWHVRQRITQKMRRALGMQ
ncbi:hypothetical protein AB4Y44_27940 [Paraburkholderia sp. BR10937]|uniref:non-homologous end-joining DNA ligase LigD n=1 Tax=Paraburkholderia sp. BR10937 TaxID=3236994 RepID=UPI0034D2DE56